MIATTILEKPRAAEILLIEDNLGDIILAQKAFRQARMAITIIVAKTGEEAMDILLRQGAHAEASRPDLILLDLNLPRKSGLDVLTDIKGSPALKNIPVVVLTSSRAEVDVEKAYGLHANSYMAKPANMDEFATIVAAIENYWLSLVVFADISPTKNTP